MPASICVVFVEPVREAWMMTKGITQNILASMKSIRYPKNLLIFDTGECSVSFTRVSCFFNNAMLKRSMSPSFFSL